MRQANTTGQAASWVRLAFAWESYERVWPHPLADLLIP
jgi:hypothetical protein